MVLHVGTPKSGTTYLQELLWQSRAELAEVGVSVPGESMVDHFHAAVELSAGDFHGWRDPAVSGAWGRLVEAARLHEDTTVISHELFGDLSQDAAAQAVADLDFAEVHVVVTCRDLIRQLPAVWQEDLKNRWYLPFADFLEVVRHDTSRPDVMRPWARGEEGHGEAFWRRQDIAAVLGRWGASLPPAQVHVVTLPQTGAGSSQLWHRFAQVLGVDPTVATLPTSHRNTSLGRAESELLRRLNERLDYHLEWPLYGPRITHDLAVTELTQRPDSVPLVLPQSARAWASVHADEMIAKVTALGCTVVGDLEDLRIRPCAPEPDRRSIGEPEVLDAALDALIGLLRRDQVPPRLAEELPTASEATIQSATLERTPVDVGQPEPLPSPCGLALTSDLIRPERTSQATDRAEDTERHGILRLRATALKVGSELLGRHLETVRRARRSGVTAPSGPNDRPIGVVEHGLSPSDDELIDA